MGGERRSRNLRPAFDFSDHRPYASGDDLRHVDWNTYGRHEELFVKLGEATQSVNVHVLLDHSRSMVWQAWKASAGGQKSQDVSDFAPARGQTGSLKWDGARRLAGAMGYLALAGGERLVMTPFANALSEGFGPVRGKRQALRALDFVAAVTPAAPLHGQSGLAASLTAYARAHPEGGLLVLVSDMLDSATPSGSALLEGLRHYPPPRWQVLVLHLLTQQEVDPALEGDVDLQDVETGERLPFHVNDSTLERYRRRVGRWCERLQSACARRGATYSRVLADWPLEQAVIPYLRQRKVLQ
jgi:uncharacterized protein (DUF58 family)